ncbi:aldose epimerase family protein [Marinomonas atlantica]|uniref:aldose epimerase family protein n=1 Tax=Marinomonas atlantica TaxID=1806668 RepID=UPI00083322BE|nr:aldose epimerase family protein [Marinomonas atlantica]
MIKVQLFGEIEGRAVDKITLSNNYISISMITYGMRTTEIKFADRHGSIDNIVLSYPNLNDYLNDNSFLGAICGRVANRISGHQFSNESGEHSLEANEGNHHLHGGSVGFDKRIWQYETHQETNSVTFYITSEDGDMGYPGRCELEVNVALQHNQVTTSINAISNKNSIINITDHCYYNLTGDSKQTILNHKLLIPADFVTPTDHELIPTGEFLNVKKTNFDFSNLRDIHQTKAFYAPSKGYDINYCLLGDRYEDKLACKLYDPSSGRQLSIFTTELGLQLYTGGFLSHDGIHGDYTGVALEPQNYPNSANIDHFPSAKIGPNLPYHHTIRHVFEIV